MACMFRYGICLFLFAASLGAFASQRTIVVEPHQIEKTYSYGDSPYKYSDSRSWAEPVSHQTGKVSVPVTKKNSYLPTNFKTGLKTMMKLNPADVGKTVALGIAFAGVDWLFDPENNSIQKQQQNLDGQPLGKPVTTSQCSIIGGHPTCCNKLPYSEMSGGINTTYQGRLYSLYVGTSAAAGYAQRNNCSGYPSNAPREYYRVYLPQDVSVSNVPVTYDEIDGFVDGYDPNPTDFGELQPKIGISPDASTFTGPSSIQLPSTQTTTSTPDGTTVTDVSSSVGLQYGQNPLSITTNNTTTTTVYNNGTQVSTSTTTETGPVVDSGSVTQSDIPTDCEFMPTVCEFIDWFKTPIDMPEPDLPVVEDKDFGRSYNVNFGGNCPPPRSMTILDHTVYFYWTDACQFAAYLKFLIVGGAALYAAYISLGLGSRTS